METADAGIAAEDKGLILVLVLVLVRIIILILLVVKKIVAKDWRPCRPSVLQVTRPKPSPAPTSLFQLVLMYCEIQAQEKVIKQMLGKWTRRASRSFSTFIFLQLSFQFVNLAPSRCASMQGFHSYRLSGNCTFIGTFAKMHLSAPILGGFKCTYFFYFFLLQKILQCWQKYMPIPNFSDHNLVIKKGHPPNLKGVQVKNAKMVFLSPSRFKFGSEWRPCHHVKSCSLSTLHHHLTCSFSIVNHCTACFFLIPHHHCLILPSLTPAPGVSPVEGHCAPDGPQGHNPVRGEGRELIIEVRLVLCPLYSLTLPLQSFLWIGESQLSGLKPLQVITHDITGEEGCIVHHGADFCNLSKKKINWTHCNIEPQFHPPLPPQMT